MPINGVSFQLVWKYQECSLSVYGPNESGLPQNTLWLTHGTYVSPQRVCQSQKWHYVYIV